MVVANQATGKVKKYQAVCGSTLILILPISWIFLKLGFPAYSVFIVHFIMEGICQVARMLMLRPLIGLRLRDYFLNIYLRIIIVVSVSIIMPSAIYFTMDIGFLRFIAVGFASVFSVLSSAYFLGLSPSERVFLRSKIDEKLKNWIKKK